MPSYKSCSDKYPAYKDSGVEWLGKIPVGWDIHPGLRFISENKSKNTGMIRNTVLSLSYGKIRVKKEDELSGLVPESFETYQQVNKGDLIFRPTDLQNDKVSLRSAYSEYDGIITNAYLNLKFSQIADSKFFHYFFRAIDNNKIIYGLGSGLRQNISYLDFRRFLFPFPPLTEQTAIAAFLDDKTAKIDRSIAQKEQLIALLKERKQIIIQDLVTGKKVWDKDKRAWTAPSKTKDSGLEYIGEIPAHWEVRSVKSIFQLSNKAGKEGLPILSVSIHSAVSDNELDAEENIRGKIRIQSKEDYKLVQPGDIVYNMMRAWQGGIGAVRTLGLVSPAYVVVSPKQKIESQYFEYLMRNNLFINEMNKVSRGITDFRKRLYWDEFKNLCILIPNYVEQKAIVEAIETQSSKIDKAIELQNMQIEKLKEYKSVLVDAAVTGKIKVI